MISGGPFEARRLLESEKERERERQKNEAIIYKRRSLLNRRPNAALQGSLAGCVTLTTADREPVMVFETLAAREAARSRLALALARVSVAR